MKKIAGCILLSMLLSSCFWRPGNTDGEASWTWITTWTWTSITEDKQSFFIETRILEDFPTSYNIEKTGKLSSTQSVNLSSNAAGKIQSINVKEGQAVKSGQLLATLADNIGNFNLNVERANNAVSRAEINYESQKIALDKQIADADLALSWLTKNLENLKITNEQNIERNANDKTNINSDEELAKTDLNIERLDQNIVKIGQNIGTLELNIETQILNDNETLSSFKNTIKNEQNRIRIILDDVIEFSDELLWVTPENQNANDNFQRFLWVRDPIQLQESETSLQNLINFRNGEFETFLPTDISNMTDIQILRAADTGERAYDLIANHLERMEKTLQNSIPSSGLFSQSTIDGYENTINNFQSNNQASISSFVTQKNQVVSFISTYEKTIESIEKQIEILEQDIEILNKDKEILLNDRIVQEKNLESSKRNLDIWLESTITQWNDAVVSLENQIAATKLNITNAKANKTITLQSLTNQIREAEINASEAVNQRAKLSIFAPISWTISSIEVDIWQEVSNWGGLFLIENTSSSELIIGLTDEELGLVKVWMEVAVQYNGEVEKADIFSISSVADANLNYKTAINLKGNGAKIWEILKVYIPIESKNILAPLNIVDVDSVGTSGELVTYNKEKWLFEDLWVELGKNYGEEIEILGCENPIFNWDSEDAEIPQFVPCEIFNKSEVVTSNVSNFDKNKFKIVRKQ